MPDRLKIGICRWDVAAFQVKAALKDDPENRTICINRVYGLGGLDFFLEDAEAWFRMALETARTGKIKKRFDQEGISIPFPQQDVHIHQVST